MSLENTSDPQSIASFLLFQTGLAWWFHNIKPLDDLFARMQHLRVLVLNGIPFSKFRGSITHLKHLRYLGFNNSNTALANKEENLVNKRNNNNIVEPPESVRNLCHLQTLELTSLEWHSDGVIYHDLPNWILNLVNLRHLIYDKDYPTVSVGFPVGIGRLTNLRTLPGFLVSKKHDHAKLGELRDMNDIEGTLAITDIDHLTDVDEAKKACLEKKRKLQSLQLKWDSLWGSPSQIDDAVLENLKPCPKLGNLRISSFKGAATPSWLGHPSFSRLTNIELDGCHNWASLPPFGQLPSLLYLSIKSAMSVKSIGREFFSGGFPQLRTLQLKDMQNWKTWDGVREGECPHLRELNIAGCIVLESLSVVNLNALETLRISGCYRIRFPSDEQLPSSLQVFNVKGSAFLPEWCRCHMRSLLRIQQLQVEGLDYHHLVLQNVWCVREAKDFTLKFKQEVQFLELTWDDEPNLVSSANCGPAEEVLENLQPCSNLTELVIRGYNGSMLASWLGDPAFSSLVSVTLHGCRQCKLLPALGLLPRLTKLHIKGAHALRCIGKEFFNGCGRSLGRPAFPYLKRLEFDDMPNWEEWAEMENFDLPYLHELIIKHCPLLQKLPPLPPTLNNIEIEDCNTMIIPSSLNHLILLHTFRISQVPTLHQLPVLPSALKILTVRYLPALANPVMPTSIQDLELQGCNEAFVAASLAHLTHITSLKIIDFPNLMELPLHNLVNLRDLHVSTCPRLQTIDCFYFSHALPEFIEGLQALKSLEHLSVSDCPKLHFSANERLPSALRSMNIFNCPSAASWRDRIWRKQEHRVDSS
ncbi:hypothetical protein Taro_043090 [Colocasia esculenta]|uniref:R13L1/DRL21-like LRR repeat region domain-containing protein n=1 Tax=Colocasia esculenta TaxID=4460 RepID=A0A843WR72_COLES|nr:hypothetical protein [Colocasia esculenta]